MCKLGFSKLVMNGLKLRKVRGVTCILLFVVAVFMFYGAFIYSSFVSREPRYHSITASVSEPHQNKQLEDQRRLDPASPQDFHAGDKQFDKKSDEECTVFKTINITYKEISEDEPCEANFCPTLEGNKRKIASYNFSQAEPYMTQLEPKPSLESIFKGPGTSNIEIPVFVGGASSNHMGEAVRLINHLNRDIRPAYPTLKLFFYDLGLTASQFQELETLCKCTMIKFPFEKFPSHVKQLFGYTWKPLIIKMMLQDFRFVIWLDTSVILETADLDPLFIQAKKQGVMSRSDAHLLAAHTHEDTFRFLQEPPCLYRKFKEFIGRLLIFHSDNELVNDYVIQPWVKCALTEECMKTKHNTRGTLLACRSHKIYHSCHRYDQSILSLLMYRLFSGSYMEHHIGDKYFIPR